MAIENKSIKVGRSFNISERRRGVRRVSTLEVKPTVICSYTAVHQVVYDVEQEILTELRLQGFQYKYTWTNEAFYKSCEDELGSMLEDYVTRGVLKRVS